MDYFAKVKERVTGLATGITGYHGGRGERSQTVTISRSRAEIDQFWHNPEKLSQVLDHIATVRSPESGVFEWLLPVDVGGTPTWRTRLLSSDDGLRFVTDPTDSGDTGGAEVVVTYRQAPNELGTEVTLDATTPFPDFLTGAALFTVLYRARALLQTGEVPTLFHNPSAREIAH